MEKPVTIEVDGVPVAVRHGPGALPGIVWLGGYRSDMRGAKAEAIAAWAASEGRAVTRHDYSGHGESGGAFLDGTISRWTAESRAVMDRFAAGPQVLVGSSMGAWIALRLVAALLAEGRTGRVAGLVLIAPAPDFTSDLVEPALTRRQRRDLAVKGFFEEPSAYGPDAYVYTSALIEDGRACRVLTGPIDTRCPVHVVHGMADADVPHTHALKLVSMLPADDVTLSLVPDGDHRLSRPQDIALIIRAIGSVIEQAGHAS